jgi:hypothetical protein
MNQFSIWPWFGFRERPYSHENLSVGEEGDRLFVGRAADRFKRFNWSAQMRLRPAKGECGAMAGVAAGRCDCHRHPGWMLDVTRSG